MSQIMNKSQYAALGQKLLKEKSEHLYKLYDAACPKFDTEYDFVRRYQGNLKRLKWVYCCGTLCFYKVNKQADTELTKDEMEQVMKTKLKKDLELLSTLESIPESERTAKQNKSILLAYTALRTSIMLNDLIKGLNDEVVFIIGTRGPTKVSVDNFSLTGYDLGSGIQESVKKGDKDVIKSIKDAALALGENKWVTVTGGSNEERVESAKMIRQKIEENCELTQDELNTIYFKIQPIRHEVEKTSILDQRELFLSKKNYLLIQGGNRDAIFVDCKKFVANISFKLTEDWKKTLVEEAKKIKV